MALNDCNTGSGKRQHVKARFLEAAAAQCVVLETEAQIAGEARRIYLQAGVTHAMPPGNLSYMEPAERAAIVEWFRRAGAKDPV